MNQRGENHCFYDLGKDGSIQKVDPKLYDIKVHVKGTHVKVRYGP